MPEMFYQQLRRQRRRAALSVTAFVLTLCLLPLALECDDFDAQRMKAIRHRANQKWNQQYHLSQQISISDSYTQFRLNLVLAARDNGELRSWVSTQPERLLQRAVPIVQAAVAREQRTLFFPALHQCTVRIINGRKQLYRRSLRSIVLYLAPHGNASGFFGYFGSRDKDTLPIREMKVLGRGSYQPYITINATEKCKVTRYGRYVLAGIVHPNRD